MPCHRCGARQADPVRGPSPWKRGVRGGDQVLVCPDCQRGRDWTADLDACPHCGSTALQRALGETVCRACRRPVDSAVPAPVQPPAAGDAAREALADDVAAAVERVLRSSPGTPTA